MTYILSESEASITRGILLLIPRGGVGYGIYTMRETHIPRGRRALITRIDMQIFQCCTEMSGVYGE